MAQATDVDLLDEECDDDETAMEDQPPSAEQRFEAESERDQLMAMYGHYPVISGQENWRRAVAARVAKLEQLARLRAGGHCQLHHCEACQTIKERLQQAEADYDRIRRIKADERSSDSPKVGMLRREMRRLRTELQDLRRAGHVDPHHCRECRRAERAVEDETYKMVCGLRVFVLWTVNQFTSAGVAKADLFQAGMLGAKTGVERYDPQRPSQKTDGEPVTLTSYASWWIRRGIQEAISAGNEDQPWKISRQQRQHKAILQRLSQQFRQQHERWPTADELLELAHGSDQKLVHGVRAKQVAEFLRGNVEIIRLDDTVSETDDRAQATLIGDEREIGPEQLAFLGELFQLTEAAIDSLSHVLQADPRQDRGLIGQSRLGLDQALEDLNLDQLGARFDCSKEQVRQLQLRAMRHLEEHFDLTMAELLAIKAVYGLSSHVLGHRVRPKYPNADRPYPSYKSAGEDGQAEDATLDMDTGIEAVIANCRWIIERGAEAISTKSLSTRQWQCEAQQQRLKQPDQQDVEIADVDVQLAEIRRRQASVEQRLQQIRARRQQLMKMP